MPTPPPRLRRLRTGLASYRQAVDSIVWLDARTGRCPLCGRRGIDGCDPAHEPHPPQTAPGRLRRAAHTARIAWHLRTSLPTHLRHPYGSNPPTSADAPF